MNITDILSEIPKRNNTNPLSIYIHIPFCKRKCNYCNFNSYAQEPSEDYFDALMNEIGSFGEIITRPIHTIYFGGGTPSIIRTRIIGKILNQVYKHFTVQKDAEITIEVNPESITINKLREYMAFGINRISAGIQSFKEEFLKILGRTGGVEDNIKLFKILKRAGFENISADLMYGLPGQDICDWLDDLKKLVAFEPDHISAYMLTPPEGMGRVSLPSEETRRMMLLDCIEFLEANGWYQYEISNYARKGYECRHNLNYWNWGEYIGIGAGAHSFLKGKIKNNILGIRWWNKHLPDEILTTSLEERVKGFEFITQEMALEEFIMLGLRKRRGIDLIELKGITPLDVGKFIMYIMPLIKDGFLLYENNYLKLTVNGIAVINSIITKVWESAEKSTSPS